MKRSKNSPFKSGSNMQSFAACMHVNGRSRLAMPVLQAAKLKEMIRMLNMKDAAGEESLRRLKAEAGHIETCLHTARQKDMPVLPAYRGTPRILHLARHMLAGGENSLGRERILEEIAAFDAVHPLEMREIMCMPAALNVALCEAFVDLIWEAQAAARERQRAESWVHGREDARCPRHCGEVFLVHALQLCADLEKPGLHAQVERRISRMDQRSEALVEKVHRSAADRCLRLDQMMQLKHLLAAMDWQECFEQLSAAEIELRDDPAGIYAAMDDESRACIREYTARLAADLKMNELSVVRYALQAAREAVQNHGAHDPRATVCWYLAEDAGRRDLYRMLGEKKHPPRRIPDPEGKCTASMLAVLTALVWALMLWSVEHWLLVPGLLPLAWVFVQQILARCYPRFLKPGRILKMHLESVPDSARTLVVLPVLLSSAARTREILAHLEDISCMEKDENIDFLLLGDFRDAGEAQLEDDEAILSCAREGIARLNASVQRKKYFYLHRSRSFREQDARWMGENRKRGALTALNRLLLERSEAAEAFGAESACAAELTGRYRYAVTLDADTEYLPGTLQKLIGAMRHPLNRSCFIGGRRRGYAVLQPCMQLMAEACSNEYVRITAGEGGINSYPVSNSDFYQDFTGRGCFAGKGIYDIRAFAEQTDGILQDDAILSHDLIEGILSGAGFLNDVYFYDGCPDQLGSDLVRTHRWTRGDWQLLPVLLSRLNITILDRVKMLGNLLRSLYAPALVYLFVLSVWLDAPGGFLLGLMLAFLNPILNLRRAKEAFRSALLKLALLPAEAACAMDAILRTLWRLAVSRKHLMDWVPAADACGGMHSRLPGRVAALLVLPGLLRPFWIPAVLALAALFFMAAGWAEELGRTSTDSRGTLNETQKQMLEELARKTWLFFETHVPENGCGLPPDNVQLDPPVGAAMRTSPTNIGLYMMSCICAAELGFIDEENMHARLDATISTLEKLEKWNGQIYNWYDTETLQPLRPRYVSAVDSGNLAGALLLCAEMLADKALSGRLLALVRNMNLAALYDEKRNLFYIGLDAETDRLSQSHYDLYASEARILSFCAMMLGQVPLKHWRHLSRTMVGTDKNRALASWSGTMFEYLMPELILRSHPNTLAAESRRGAVAAQMDFAKPLNRPWGVSESAYYAFDMHLNYQYRAFGLRSLAMNGSAVQDVVAPYAAALALEECPGEAAENLRRMCELGWCGEMGMYEAADYMHMDGARHPRIVRSHMAHHQGMMLCALCNALKDDVLSRSFMRIPQARALRLLLQERLGARVRLKRQMHPVLHMPEMQQNNDGFDRSGRKQNYAPDTHLLHGGKTTVLVTARGAAHAWSEGLQLNRFSGSLSDEHQGMYVHIRDAETGENAILGREGKTLFNSGSVRFVQDFSGMEAELHVVVSPEDGTVYQQINIHNAGEENRTLDICGCFAVALAPERDMCAHPVFQNLFVESESIQKNALVFRRRGRESGQHWPALIYMVTRKENLQHETSLEKLAGRTGSLGMPGGIAADFSGSEGHVLNPCAALKLRIQIPAGSRQCLHFALALAEEERLKDRLMQLENPSAPERACRLASAQIRSMLGHAGIDGRHYRLLQRSAALLFDPMLRKAVMENNSAQPQASRDTLWRMGISGDLPVMLVEIQDENGMDCAREAVRAHAFYRMMGVQMDFVAVNGHGNDYHQPVRGALGDLIASSHLNGQFHKAGGAYVLEKQNLEAEEIETLRRWAALHFLSGQDFCMQLRSQLEGLYLREAGSGKAMRGCAMPMPENLRFFNGYGGFDEKGYAILLRDGILPPAPWSNVLSGEKTGAIVTERGGGFAWYGNSRSARLTPFANDALREGWGWMFYLLDDNEGSWIRLLPGDVPMTDFCVRHAPGESRWRASAEDIAFEVEMRAETDGIRFDITLENEGGRTRHLRLAGLVNWLMGTTPGDSAALCTWSRFGACFASGSMQGIGCFLSDDPQARPGCDLRSLLAGGDMMQPQGLDVLEYPSGGWSLHLPVSLRPKEMRRCRFLLGWAADIPAAYQLARDFRSGEALRRSRDDWQNRLEKLKIETPDSALNLMANGFLQAQILNARIRGRTGLYQPGGAFGFRDQLQDMLPMIHYEPQRVRSYLLYCAARQFEGGDVLHWWHKPYSGVRTKISDDLLFLPYVAAQYVHITGDASVLQEHAPFLKDIAIPETREDIYAPMQPTVHTASLHEHCMRAFRRAAYTGEHGLCRMGTGDWNDGMNRVGMHGRGESVWLTQFLAVCAADYARISPNPQDSAWLIGLNKQLCASLEEHGWDGEWYLRAYTDGGEKLGSSENDECRIDAISQAWAVLAGLDERRCESAMDAAWKFLADEECGIIRLITPPFSGQGIDPGYIAAYPPGVRENGAQYTHAACWILYALAEMGDEQRAHRALNMLLPPNHAASREAADIYRVEPYVMAADIYSEGEHAGRGGWTWYTGSAAWLLMSILKLLGFERQGNRVRMHALLGSWPEAAVTLHFGLSRYRLVCRAEAETIQLDGERIDGEWIEMIDDGRDHAAVFPPRKAVHESNK